MGRGEIADLVRRARNNGSAVYERGLANLAAASRAQELKARSIDVAKALSIPVQVPAFPQVKPPEFPVGSTCAICAGPAVGALHREPLGRDGALVNVCIDCETIVPTEGQYRISGGRIGTGVGEGNHRAGSRGPT
jgi:hypothetical protein